MTEFAISPPGAAPLDLLLAGYAAGQLNPALQALVGAHLELCQTNRGYVRSLEALAAQGLAQHGDMALGEPDRMLNSIFSSAPPAEPAPVVPSRLPQSIVRLIGSDLDAIRWRRMLPGIKEFRLPDESENEASLLWISAGKLVPTHTHEGTEITLVINGSFADSTGQYRRGDVVIADGSVNHAPRAGVDEDCLCFAVLDAPLRLTGPFGRLIQRFRH